MKKPRDRTPDIQRLHAKARAYMDNDPEVSLMCARKAVESLTKSVYETNTGVSADTLTLDKLISKLGKEKWIPPRLKPHLSTIQSHGNFGSHDQGVDNAEIDTDYTQPCMLSLDYVVKWHLPKNSTPNEQPQSIEVNPELKPITLDPPIIVSDLAELMQLQPFQLMADLIKLEVFVAPHQEIESEIAERLAIMHGFNFKRSTTKKNKKEVLDLFKD